MSSIFNANYYQQLKNAISLAYFEKLLFCFEHTLLFKTFLMLALSFHFLLCLIINQVCCASDTCPCFMHNWTLDFEKKAKQFTFKYIYVFFSLVGCNLVICNTRIGVKDCSEYFLFIFLCKMQLRVMINRNNLFWKNKLVFSSKLQ